MQKKGRDSFELEIFGMVGVPQELVQERLVKVYGEPAAKRQKVEMTAPRDVLLPGVGIGRGFVPARQPQLAFMGRGQHVGMPVQMQQGFMPPMMHPMYGAPRMMPPQMMQQMAHGRGMMPPQMMPGQPMMRPPQGQPGLPTQPGQQMAPRPHQPGLIQPPQIRQQPISQAAKVDIVDRADTLIQQGTSVKKSTKKQIIRIYDNPGISMEEARAAHPNYALSTQI